MTRHPIMKFTVVDVADRVTAPALVATGWTGTSDRGAPGRLRGCRQRRITLTVRSLVTLAAGKLESIPEKRGNEK